jgi:hypothetical protein
MRTVTTAGRSLATAPPGAAPARETRKLPRRNVSEATLPGDTNGFESAHPIGTDLP